MSNYINGNEHLISDGIPTGFLVSDFYDFVSSNLDRKEARHLLASFLVTKVCGIQEANIIGSSSDIDRARKISVVYNAPVEVLNLDEWRFFIYNTDSILSVGEEEGELTVTTLCDTLPMECSFGDMQMMTKKRVG